MKLKLLFFLLLPLMVLPQLKQKVVNYPDNKIQQIGYFNNQNNQVKLIILTGLKMEFGLCTTKKVINYLNCIILMGL